MQTKVIEKNNKQRRCGRVGRLDQVSLFFRRNKSGELFLESNAVLAGCGNISLVRARFPVRFTCLLFKFKSQVMSSCLLYNVCLYESSCVDPLADIYTQTHTYSGVATLCDNFFSRVSAFYRSIRAHPRETFMYVLIELSVSTLCDKK